MFDLIVSEVYGLRVLFIFLGFIHYVLLAYQQMLSPGILHGQTVFTVLSHLLLLQVGAIKHKHFGMHFRNLPKLFIDGFAHVLDVSPCDSPVRQYLREVNQYLLVDRKTSFID